MGNTKTEFKWFTIPQYRKEEEYLCNMHNNGWKLTKVRFPGFYHFEKCEPRNVTYRLDYNQEGVANKSEYVQMFSDCGWEYLFDFVGYSYFRKATEQVDGNEEIFCDDDSRLDMMKRVFKGRVAPLIIIFFCIILPQLFLNHAGYGGGSVVQDVLFVLFIILGLVYIFLFGSYAVQFYQYEKSIYPEKSLKAKYGCIFGGLLIGVLVMGYSAYSFFSSDYEIIEDESGFTIEADRLNSSIEKEYTLKKGDTLWVKHESDGGEWDISIGIENEEPVFSGNTYNSFEDFSVTIQEDGNYVIKCSGKRAQGKITFDIK